MFCWGNNRYDQLGLAGIEDETCPLPVDNKYFENRSVKQIACGYQHTLFLMQDGTVLACGNNQFGQLGYEGERRRPEQIRSLETCIIEQVACGHSFSLALTDKKKVLCWGSVNGTRDPDLYFTKPTLIKGLEQFTVVQIACGYQYFMALTEDGKVYVMGVNEFGQLGLGTSQNTQIVPTYLRSLQGIPVMQIACGAYHSMVLTISGNIFAFGRNNYGQLGFGDTTDRLFPVNLKFSNTQKACFVACGEEFTSILTKDGGVFTFGAGMYGQLGHNSFENQYLPRKVFDLMGSEVTQIACGRCHTLAYIASSNRVYSFGLSNNGQLGIAVTNVNKISPTHVSSVNLSKISERPSDSVIKLNYLHSIYAGGDQSFILYKQEPVQLDYREILNERQILSITAEHLNTLIPLPTNAIEKRSELNRVLQTVFTSAACLNASFLNKNDHYGTSNRYPGIDLKQARLIFDLLVKSDTSVVNQIIQMLTDLFNSLPDSPPSIEALRLYVTAPLFYAFSLYATMDVKNKLFFDNQQNIYMLFFAYAQAINRLRKEGAGRVLDYWFAWTGPEFFSKLVNIYKSVVEYILYMQPTTNPTEIGVRNNILKSSMTFLQKLHKINLEYHEIVPYDTFYIPSLVEKYNIKQDYWDWLRKKHLRIDTVLFCDYPFVFDAKAKTLLLQTDADLQMQVALQEAWHQNFSSLFLASIDPVNPYLSLYVRRDNLVQDTLNQLAKQKRDDLKKPLKVQFVGEDALDAGGVQKEFFLLLIREILDPKYGMFTYYDQTRTVWLNDQTLEETDMYFLIGELCGLAIYNHIIINLPFPLALYKKLLKVKPNLEDLKSLDPTLAKSFQLMLDYDNEDFEDIYNLTFVITRKRFDEDITVELVPNGAQKRLTRENKKEYVNAYADYIFNKSVEQPFDAFSKGFHHVCGSKVLELFHPPELMEMICGNESYDFDELEKSTSYKGEYSVNHPVIRNFWGAFHELEITAKKDFLLFLTGCDRVPILGMKITIQPVYGGDAYYPAAHTCANLLDLPMYTTREILKERLLYAIKHTQGFTLV